MSEYGALVSPTPVDDEIERDRHPENDRMNWPIAIALAASAASLYAVFGALLYVVVVSLM